MGSISRAYALTQSGEYVTAADALREELNTSEESLEWLSICEWIASCLETVGDFAKAGNWYESAGQFALIGEAVGEIVPISEALYFFERANECFRRGGESASSIRTGLAIRKLRDVRLTR